VDALGVPVQLADGDNLSIIGAAASASYAAGCFSSLVAAAKNCTPPTVEIEPKPQSSARFGEALALYRETTSILTPTLEELAARQAVAGS